MLREALQHVGRADLIGNGKKHLVPRWQPAGTGDRAEGQCRPTQGKPFRTQHSRTENPTRKRGKRGRRR